MLRSILIPAPALLLSALALTLAGAALPLSARGIPPSMHDSASARLTVPFAFSWEGREYRAGDYRVDVRSCKPMMVVLQRIPTRGLAAMMATRDWLFREDTASPWRPVFRSTCSGTQCQFELLELRWAPLLEPVDSGAGSPAYDTCAPEDAALANARIRFD